MAKAKQPKIVKVGEYNSYTLEPCATRTHYEDRSNGGGTLFAYPTKTSRDAWFVKSRIDGRTLGVIEESGDEDFTFVKLRGLGKQITPTLKRTTSDMIGTTYYELAGHCISGTSLEGVLGRALGIEHPA
jgi:hypothetical protein